MISDLDDLFAPLGAAAFFADWYESRPAHLAAHGANSRVLITHEELFAALEKRGANSAADGDSRGGAATRGAQAGLVLFPEHVGSTAEELLADPGRMRAYFDAGHPLVWNRARGVAPRVDALAALLAEAFGARVWPNVYATGPAGTPFDIHFDAHEVIAIQCEGDKEWWLSEVRVDRPLDAPEMEAAVKVALTRRRDEAAARTLLEFTARPGDLVYIPRGQFHNARATAGRSLHVTFGIRSPSGFEIAQAALGDLLGDPMLRELLPPPAIDPDGSRTAGVVADVAARLRTALDAAALLATAGEVRGRWARPGPREAG